MEIKFFVIQLKIKLGTAENAKLKKETYLIDTTVNVCRFSSGYSTNFLLKMVLEKLKKYSNITWDCPFKPVKFWLIVKN